MRFLFDMNLTPRWVVSFASSGYEALHWSAIGPGTTPDSEICSYARENQLVLITNDLDFPQLLAHTQAAAPSVILLRGEPLVPELRLDSLLAAIAECREDLRSGAILSVDWSGRPRARLLPLK